MPSNHITTVIIGLMVGLAVVWWVRPDTSSGTVFLLVAMTLAAFIARSIFLGLRVILEKIRSSGRPDRPT